MRISPCSNLIHLIRIVWLVFNLNIFHTLHIINYSDVWNFPSPSTVEVCYLSPNRSLWLFAKALYYYRSLVFALEFFFSRLQLHQNHIRLLLLPSERHNFGLFFFCFGSTVMKIIVAYDIFFEVLALTSTCGVGVTTLDFQARRPGFKP